MKTILSPYDCEFCGEKKNGLEDLKKARKNLDFAIETLESEEK